MDKLIEYCQETYQSELDYKPSLSNIVSWLFFITSLHTFYNLKSPTLISGLSSIHVKYLIDPTDGIIPMLTIADLSMSILFLVFLMWLSRKLSEGFFYLFCLKDDFQKLIIDITIALSQHQYSLKAKKELGMSAKTDLEKNQKKMRQTRSLAEIILGVGFCSLMGFTFNLYNVGLFLFCLVAFTVLIWRSFHFYIAHVLPYFVAEKYSCDELTFIKNQNPFEAK